MRHESRPSRLACALLVLLAGARVVAQTDGTKRGFEVVADPAASSAPAGANWLVLVAINDYKNVTPLRAPLNDARELKRVLLERYAFDEEHTIELLNEDATLSGMYQLFGSLAERVAPNDSVLLYYAGHGHYDDLTNTGYWIPYDGGTQFGQNWLVDTAVQGTLRNVKAKHVFVIADSCFSGNLLQTTRDIGQKPDPAVERYRRANTFQSRVVLTSGNLEPVEDSGLGGHSAFAYHLFRTLEQNQTPYVDTFDLYYHVRAGVEGQQPLLGSLKGAGHASGGSYVFRLKEAPPLGSASAAVASAGQDRPRVPIATSSLPAAPARDLGAEIGEVLERWKQAYEALDFPALRQVWPDCPWTQRTFGAVSGFEIEMPSPCEIEGSGTRATADCRIRITPTGRRKQWREYGARFDLEQRAGAWKILTHTASE